MINMAVLKTEYNIWTLWDFRIDRIVFRAALSKRSSSRYCFTLSLSQGVPRWGSRFEEQIHSSGSKIFPNSGDSGCFCISWSTTAWHSTSSCVRKTRSSMLNLKEKGWICGSCSSLETLGSWCHVSHNHRRGDASWIKNTRAPVTFGSTKSRSLATLEALKISPSGTRFAEIVSFFLYTEQAFPLDNNRNSTLWDEGNSPHLPQINRINPTGTIQLSNSDAFSGTVQG